MDQFRFGITINSLYVLGCMFDSVSLCNYCIKLQQSNRGSMIKCDIVVKAIGSCLGDPGSILTELLLALEGHPTKIAPVLREKVPPPRLLPTGQNKRDTMLKGIFFPYNNYNCNFM